MGGRTVALLDRFRGCMVGALVGDCLGANFEGQHENLVPAPLLVAFFKELEEEKNNSSEPHQYTDDTAMALQIAVSFVANRRFSYPDLAQRFSQEYFREPWRGYGGSVVEVFNKLKKDPSEPFLPASQQFNGSGSYGNGAGMRAHPIALSCYGQPLETLVDTAVNVARITHAHRHGVTGGLLQTLAVSQALITENPADILASVRAAVASYESKEESPDYGHKLQLVHECLDKPDEDLAEIAFEMGNDVSALESVATALFCFLRGCRNFQPDSQFQETIRLAISLGGDTDTIASMAGAIAGAYLGIQAIPTYLQQRCEALPTVLDLADKIYGIVSPPFVVAVPPERQILPTPDTTVAAMPDKQVSIAAYRTLEIPAGTSGESADCPPADICPSKKARISHDDTSE